MEPHAGRWRECCAKLTEFRYKPNHAEASIDLLSVMRRPAVWRRREWCFLHSLTFDTVSHCVFIIRVVGCGLDTRTIRWVENGLCYQAEGGVTSTAKSSC